MSRRTYYEVLGVVRSADQADLKRAYRHLARTYHPDQNPNNPAAEERFKEIAEAYTVLSQPELRRRYDVFGTAYPVAQPSARPVRPERIFGFVAAELAKQFRRRVNRAKGEDLHLDISLHFIESARGCRRIIELPTREYGSEVVVRRRFEFRLPPGVKDGQVLRWESRGTPGRSGGPDGDFYIHVEVPAHPVFRRSDLDVVVKLPLTEREARDGAEVDVPTIRGVRRVRVPAGAATGRRIRLKGEGVRTKDGAKGDALLEAIVRGDDATMFWPRKAFEETCAQVRTMVRVK